MPVKINFTYSKTPKEIEETAEKVLEVLNEPIIEPMAVFSSIEKPKRVKKVKVKIIVKNKKVEVKKIKVKKQKPRKR